MQILCKISLLDMVYPKKLHSNNGLIVIRFTHRGKKFQLSRLGRMDDPIAKKRAEGILNKIGVDIASGHFTCGDNEKLGSIYNPESHYKPSSSLLQKLDKSLQDDKRLDVKSALISHLKAFKKPVESVSDAEKFVEYLQKKNLRNSTISKYIGVLGSMSEYFDEVWIGNSSSPRVEPFSLSEVRRILEWFAQSREYSYWLDYVKLLFLTGCRPGEAIALQWKHVDFERGVIRFCSSLRRGKKAWERTSGKTGIARNFPLGGELREILQARYDRADGSPDPESLVFTSKQGKIIHIRLFRIRAWKACLRELGIPYCKPYKIRHTFVSHFLHQTKDLVRCAKLTHNSRSGATTILKHYASSIGEEEVPDLYGLRDKD